MTYPSSVKDVLIISETAWGTKVSPTKDIGLLIQDVEYSWEREVIESGGIGARETQKVNGGIFDPKITLSGEFQHGRLLEYIFGTVAHVETTGDHVHTFTVSNTPPSLSCEIGNNLSAGDTEGTATGMLVESAELSIVLNEILMLSVTMAGKTVATTTTAAAAVVSTLQNFAHGLVTCNINGTAAAEVQEAKIIITAEVARSGGLASNLYQQGHAVDLKFEYFAKLGFTDATYHNLWLGGTSPSATANPTSFLFEIVADNGTAVGSGKRGMNIKLTNTVGKTFKEITTIRGLTFIEIGGHGTLSECTSTDNIASASW